MFSDLIRLETELWDLVDARLRRDHDLALSWFEPMQVIDRTPGCRVIDIAEALSITIGGTSKLVDRIENAGWCERSPNPDDGRSSTIRLTRPGDDCSPRRDRTFTDEVGVRLGEPLSTSELQRFAATVHKLRTHRPRATKERLTMATIPATMRAVVLDAPGPPDALHVRELPVPTPRAGEVLIKIEAFGLNRSELHTRLGSPTASRSLASSASKPPAPSPRAPEASTRSVNRSLR